MSDRKFSDELLHAYADGEAGEATAEIEKELLNALLIKR